MISGRAGRFAGCKGEVDRSLPDRVTELYERNAHAFDHARRSQFGERGWIDRFALGLPAGGAVLDLGCGGGEPIARHLIDRGLALTGVDSAATMIGLAKVRFARHRWLHADMRRVALDDRFHGAIAWDSLYYIDPGDQQRLIARIAGWLEPGGRFLFNTAPGRTQPGAEGAPVASLAADACQLTLDAAGFETLAFKPDDPAAAGRTVWLARKRGE